jgi:hypothetical protein
MFFRRSQSPFPVMQTGLRGVEPGALYDVEFREGYETKEKRRMTGGELSAFSVELESAPRSLLVVYRKAK